MLTCLQVLWWTMCSVCSWACGSGTALVAVQDARIWISFPPCLREPRPVAPISLESCLMRQEGNLSPSILLKPYRFEWNH